MGRISGEGGRNAQPPWVAVFGTKDFRTAAFRGGIAAWGLWWIIAQVTGWGPALTLWAAALVLFGIAFFQPWRLPRPDRVSAAVALVIVAGLFARTSALETVPYVVSLDESLDPFRGRRLFERDPWSAVRLLRFALQGFLTPWLPTLLAGRLATVVMSAISLIATYALASRLFNRSVGAFATIVLTCSYWHLVYSRTAYPYMQPIMFTALVFCVLVYALESRNDFLSYLGGVFLGASALAYAPARIVVPVFALWWLYGAWMHRFPWRSVLPIALAATVFVSPALQAKGTGVFLSRYDHTRKADDGLLTKIEDSDASTMDALRLVAERATAALKIYVSPGGWMAPHDSSPAAILDSGTLALAIAGLIMCAVRIRQSQCFLLIVWVVATVVFGQVLIDLPQAAYRAAPLLPALAIAAGLTLQRLTTVLGRFSRMTSPACHVTVGAAALLFLVPPNFYAFRAFASQRWYDPIIASARAAALGSPDTIHLFVGQEPIADRRQVRLVTDDAHIADVAALSDLLSAPLSTDKPPPPVEFILHPFLHPAESVIRRCYPDVERLPPEPPHAAYPVIRLRLDPSALEDWAGCELQESEGRGLRATYFRGENFDGDIVRVRIEDWPMRWIASRHLRQFRSIEWQGFLHIDVAGVYDLRVTGAKDGASAWIGDDIELRVGEPFRGELAAGSYPLRWRCKAVPRTICALNWIPAGVDDLQPIPPEVFRPVQQPLP